MITSREEYLSHLAQIELAHNALYFFPIPEVEKIYKINLDTRQVEAPALLSVTEDNQAEIIFFEMDRYYDKKDLSQTTCIINYQTADGGNYVYHVPCMDITTKREENKILLPWVIESNVTGVAGTVKFAFKFYEINPGTLEYLYQLNTLVATTKIGQGMQFKYVAASQRAAADYQAGIWDTAFRGYFIKKYNSAGHFRYEHASPIYNDKIDYFMREEEFAISDSSRLDEIWSKLSELSRGGVKWVEI